MGNLPYHWPWCRQHLHHLECLVFLLILPVLLLVYQGMLQVMLSCYVEGVIFNITMEHPGPANSGTQLALPRKAPAMPKPQWHPPWKLCRVISGHIGWVRCIAVDPTNEWFCTGSADRVIKVHYSLFSQILFITSESFLPLFGVCDESRFGTWLAGN